MRATLLIGLGLTATVAIAFTACGGESTTPPSQKAITSTPEQTTDELGRRLPWDSDRVYTREAVIPPQCYTKTEGKFNPCYTCHQTYDDKTRPNFMRDGVLQGVYAFSEQGETNHWLNLFVDRTGEVAAQSDQAILDYIREDNYTPLMNRLGQDPAWEGAVPYIQNLHLGAAAFDDLGFALDGSHWVAFNYKPLPSTFWPTNGSTDDVMIRLPEAFRRNACPDSNGRYSRDAYLANLSILEMNMKDMDSIDTPDINESAICADLNADGIEGVVNNIRRTNTYTGQASGVELRRMRYPEGTQFLHTVRYVDVDEAGNVSVSPRMKEVRYMKKYRMNSLQELRNLYGNEYQEKLDGNLPRYPDHDDQGFDNKFGWQIIGFIEDAEGDLRQQHWQEQQFCMGCHTTVGTTIDMTFAFPRKVTGSDGWGYIDLRGMQDAPAYNETEGEILQYLRRVGGGSEFRENDEMQARWFNNDGSVKETEVKNADVYTLITPGRERALALNKAYRVIVKEQSFVYGRDATVTPAESVYQKVNPDEITPLPPEAHIDNYDIRLEWD